jgi:predicted RNA-binding protein
MCESKVFLDNKGVREKIMDEAITIEVVGDNVIITGNMGERKEIEGARITKIDVDGHEIVLTGIK